MVGGERERERIGEKNNDLFENSWFLKKHIFFFLSTDCLRFQYLGSFSKRKTKKTYKKHTKTIRTAFDSITLICFSKKTHIQVSVRSN